ncbi:hypothetical protein [Hansschlegelia sp. KR7-227]|uniref:hypothetical protein n=1 Tax=Hansschlegelia sp. KR7-227 TaxID=3400914 RepID=UPI003C0314BD
MTSFRKIVPAALCALLVAGAALPASAEPFHGGGWGHGGSGWDHHGWGHRGWGAGGALAIGGLGLATGALIADAYDRPGVYVGPSCGETVRTHYDAYGRLVKVITQTPC